VLAEYLEIEVWLRYVVVQRELSDGGGDVVLCGCPMVVRGGEHGIGVVVVVVDSLGRRDGYDGEEGHELRSDDVSRLRVWLCCRHCLSFEVCV
jgi:hypothetical protein